MTDTVDGLPTRLAQVLQRAHCAELAAVGTERREAWRTTGELLGAAMVAGYSSQVLARCLGVSRESIRTRAERDGWVSASSVQRIGELGADIRRSWDAAGHPVTTVDGTVLYPALDLVRALASD